NMWLVTVAWKNLFRRTARSLVTLFGIGLSVATLVALVGLAEGFSSSFLEAFVKHGIDLGVLPARSSQRISMTMDEKIGDQIVRIQGVRRAAPALVDFTSLDDTALVGISLNGWPADSPLFEGLNYVEGRRLTKEDRQGVIVGSQLASLMRKSVGHT